MVISQRHFKASSEQAVILWLSFEALKEAFPLFLNNTCEAFLGLVGELLSKGDHHTAYFKPFFCHLLSAGAQNYFLHCLCSWKLLPASVISVALGVNESLPLHQIKQKRGEIRKKCLILPVMRRNRADHCISCSFGYVMCGLISAPLRNNSCNSSTCSTTSCWSSVAELPFFARGWLFPSKLYLLSRPVTWNLLQSLPFLLFSPVFFSL